MHIPDNYLSPSTCAVMAVVMLPVWAKAVKKVKSEISPKKMPMLGVCGAFSFLIMMFNVPIPGGTTAHAVGGTLIAILLGPYAATIAVTIALLIQALFFGDGGILAFGANTFNMAFIMPFVGYTLYSIIKGKLKSPKGEYIAAFVGAYVGIVAASFMASVEFGIQPLLFTDAAGKALYCPYTLQVTVPAMVGTHLLVGILEGAITAAVYAYVKKMSPDVLYEDKGGSKKPLYGLLAVLVVLCPLGLLAAGDAFGEWDSDGIKSLVGYIPKGFQNGIHYNAIAADYSIKGMNDIVGYIISAVAGIALIMIVFKVISSLRKNASDVDNRNVKVNK
ncbi:cobalt transporter CbiM [Clostridium sp. AWRP]|uniref:cobalt transporter CbiM n=1 Tax=Clostridium sp. AWRP TaxID=2212991 RepID=UPI000FD74C40|nr:cobalt transporter CbiM [Clostridium sp. AWRP]AZV58089.1 cobalt transporter CbiM [Clostridium sp. AWRP]